MDWTKWVMVVLLIVLGLWAALPTSLSSLTSYEFVTGFNVGNLLGWLGVVFGAWGVYGMMMKK